MKNIMEKIKKDILSILNDFDFIDETVYLQVKYNKSLERYSCRIIALSSQFSSIALDLTLDEDKFQIKIEEDKLDVEEIKELNDFLSSKFNKNLDDESLQKYILDNILVDKKTKKNSKKRL